MLKRFKKEPVASLILLMLLIVFFIAAKPNGITQLTSLWIGDATQTATTTPGDNDFYCYGTGEFDGALRADGGITITGTGDITATNIADITRSFHVPLSDLIISGTTPMGADGTTAPGFALTDGLPKVVYASSAEVATLLYSFIVPPDYSTGLAFRMMVSSNTATPASMGIGWNVWVNKDDIAFDAVPYSQTTQSPVTNNTATNEVLTFTADATALTGIAAGDTVTIYWWNADSRASGTTEIGAIQGRYTSIQ